jgi:hypothetical protein
MPETKEDGKTKKLKDKRVAKDQVISPAVENVSAPYSNKGKEKQVPEAQEALGTPEDVRKESPNKKSNEKHLKKLISISIKPRKCLRVIFH